MRIGADGSADWNPDAYARFADPRLRPVQDLIARIGDLPHGKVIDLGCGAGAAATTLADRWPDRKIVGVDNSPAMLARAAATGVYRRCDLADVSDWRPGKPPALIFSNAVLQWLENHATLLPHLASLLAPGGVLAVQMPSQFAAPSHRFLRDFTGEMFPDRFDFTEWTPSVATPLEYSRLLAPLGQVDLWSTEYVHRLPGGDGGHPVRRFTESTALRPFAARLTAPELAALIARYEAALAIAYPYEAYGTVLFPFRRLFFTLRVA
ncbi:MAG TPA: methyltransferase domain-containing protein [Paenirhodobacter sp.]